MAIISVTVLRHYKEKVSKCSLRHLEGRTDICFKKVKPGYSFDCTGFILLCLEAPELSIEDKSHPILLLDSTWKLLPQLELGLRGNPIRRSLPATAKTAYPRLSKIANDPQAGLASIEALYLAKKIFGEEDLSLLDNYHWKDQWLANLSL